MMLQLQCNYYNDQGESGSNACGRQSKSGYNGHQSENRQGSILQGSCRSKDGCPVGNSWHEMCLNHEVWRVADRMILTQLSTQAVQDVPEWSRSQVALISETIFWVA